MITCFYPRATRSVRVTFTQQSLNSQVPPPPQPRPSLPRSCHEHGPPSQAKDIFRQEIVIEIKCWYTISKNTEGL